uniref:Carboxypeptidase Q n=1 Tax=Octopus bimaculoides TaxID=37653 RepID=A0A0L8GYP7_OCTBM
MQKQWKILIFIVISLKCCVTAPIDIREEISKYKDVADKIIQYAVYGAAQNQSYNRLAKFTDMFGNRVAGSQNLENSISYILHSMMSEGLENVHGEHVKVPHWVRGKESATMLEPQYHEMAILGLGSSIATPKNGIKAEVLVVNSFEELRKKAQLAEGKIVVFNQKWISYGETVKYRSQGASEAARVGALASLIRSVTPFSIYSPHTGHQAYSEGVRKIPTACITVEDADMMERMSKRGSKIVVVLKMSAQTLNSTDSRNIVAEVVGHKYPEQTVLVSGHIDSWDVGQGAMDDGGGAFISWQALTILHELDLRPKRTVRAVLWTAEQTPAAAVAMAAVISKLKNRNDASVTFAAASSSSENNTINKE